MHNRFGERLIFLMFEAINVSKIGFGFGLLNFNAIYFRFCIFYIEGIFWFRFHFFSVNGIYIFYFNLYNVIKNKKATSVIYSLIFKHDFVKSVLR